MADLTTDLSTSNGSGVNPTALTIYVNDVQRRRPCPANVINDHPSIINNL
jgi:hypothetical protein